jgi:PH-interacting protein
MSASMKEPGAKGTRWKRTTTKDQYMCTRDLKGESSVSASNKLIAPNHDVDEFWSNTETNDQNSSRRSQQGGSTAYTGKPGSRTCRQTRSEKLKTSERGQQRNMERSSMLREKGIRTRKSLAWLLLSEVEEGTRYVPQYGDEVAYLRQVKMLFYYIRISILVQEDAPQS